ncbi:hypothetical protein [Corynebacterium sp. HMSC27B11]|uniref:hypothetical protein n=1 Tax=Corynebacterium sp. HMSC27B11 TaxID=1581065 RepID=UPI001FED33B3|nr:hypothetical protein [Corynebacterium sp. HMSC27B11]
MQHPQPIPGPAPTPGSHMPAQAGGPTPNSPEAQADHLAENIDELLSQRLEGTEEAEMLEQAHSLISKALGQG